MIVLLHTFFCQLIVIKPQIGSFLLFPCLMIWFHLRNVQNIIKKEKIEIKMNCQIIFFNKSTPLHWIIDDRDFDWMNELF